MLGTVGSWFTDDLQAVCCPVHSVNCLSIESSSNCSIGPHHPIIAHRVHYPQRTPFRRACCKASPEFTSQDHRAYFCTSAVTFVGLIYLVILSFVSHDSGHLAMYIVLISLSS